MLCVLFICVLLWEIERTLSMILHTNNMLGSFFSHRAHRVNRAFLRTFRAHRRPPAYRVHRALLLKVAVRFCDIGWLNVSVGLCVFCSSVFFCEKKNAPTWWDDIHANLWGGLSLTELTDLTEPYSALFRSHRTPPAYRFHRTLHLSLDVTCVRERVNKIIINLYN